MRPMRLTEAHQSGRLAELVCSNSLRSDDWENNAVGLLHEEMRRAGSLVMAAADGSKVPAGGALAVDRDAFSRSIDTQIRGHDRIRIECGEITAPPAEWDNVVIATGPLTSAALSQTLRARTGEESLAFF